MRRLILLLSLTFSFTVGQVASYLTYSPHSVQGSGGNDCPSTQELKESISHKITLLINQTIIQSQQQGACGCGGIGWTRVAYLDMSDTTQTCPGEWELITDPRSCGRPANSGGGTCFSAFFSSQNTEYSQVCGRVIGYQYGQPEAFVLENANWGSPQNINGPYVDGVSLTYGNPRQHIWTFVASPDEYGGGNRCPCTASNSALNTPSFVGNDYFCETGVPYGEGWRSMYYPNDPLWDGQGCSPESNCCTFNNPPWFCKKLLETTNAHLEVRLCDWHGASTSNIPIRLMEIYIKS